MPHAIAVPRLGWSMEEGVFVRWLKREGDFVRRGEPLFELEGEKALQEIESVDEGYLRIPPDAPAAGSTVAVGKVLAYLVVEGEPIPENAASPAPTPIVQLADPKLSPSSTGQAAKASDSAIDPGSLSIASPRARRAARELGVDWTGLTGSGAGGRIRECDVHAATAPVGKRLPISARRRLIAARMTLSRQHVVPVTLTTRADATRLVAAREEFKSSGAAIVPGYHDFFIRLVAALLPSHPLLAARWDEDAIILPADNGFHIGLAVDTDEGLLVPMIRNPRSMTILEIAATTRELAGKARSGRLAAAEMQGAVFTVTNLGAFGIDAFTPVINYPESAILGLGAIRREPVFLDDGRVVSRHFITLSLTFDHRILDGAPAARFLQALAAELAELPTQGPSR